MEKNKKSIIFLIITFICVTTIIIKDKLYFKDDIYIVSKEEPNNKESILANSEDAHDNYEEVNNIKKDTLDDEINSEMITVYISGQVNNPGVVTLENSKRLADAIELLGGVTEDADLNRINMALKIKDEEHYIIPKIGEEISNDSLLINNTIEANSKSESNKININLATIKELEDLPGVGEATANKIVRYRDENGNFKSIEEIKNVNGIGDKKYEDLKELISINWYNNIERYNNIQKICYYMYGREGKEVFLWKNIRDLQKWQLQEAEQLK